jgi:hypothetical protein
MNPAIEPLAFLTLVVTDRSFFADGHDLDRILRDAELDKELPDRLRPAQRQTLVIFDRPVLVSVALDENRPVPLFLKNLLLLHKYCDGVSAQPAAVKVEVDVGVHGVGGLDRRRGHKSRYW